MKYYLFSIFVFFQILVVSQKKIKVSEKPKLVVGIVVDQMRFDYLSKFHKNFSSEGFKKLMHNGAFFKNHHISYVPTVTAAGHASIYTGSTPSSHGMIGNSWYDQNTGSKIYCVHNDRVKPVGTTSPAGRKSPVNLKVTTITDQLKLATQGQSKVISIALKDRASILSGGHTADASYWFNPGNYGKWITSSYYLQDLPDWIHNFNKQSNINSYLKEWKPFKNLDIYVNVKNDHESYERGFKGKIIADFPYKIDSLSKKNRFYNIIRTTPWGTTMTFDLAKEAIKNEFLGQDAIPDFLSISLSSTDYIGHNFGADSVEVEDAYLRLDNDLADFLQYLNKKVGENNYTLFLTSDHGAGANSAFLKTKKIPASYFKEASYRKALSFAISKKFSVENPIKAITNQQVYLNVSTFENRGIPLANVQKFAANWLRKNPEIEQVFTKDQIENNEFKGGMISKVKNGYYSKRSGDIIYVLNTNSVAYAKTGSAHGSGYQYDAHIPLFFYGLGITAAVHYESTDITDIATTLAYLLQIEAPNAATGTILPVHY